MPELKTVRDFAKSRYSVCFLIAMAGLYTLLRYSATDLPFSENFINIITSGLTGLQTFLGGAAATDVLKLTALLWTMTFLTPVLSGNNQVSFYTGAVLFITGLLLTGLLTVPVFTIGNKLFGLLILYFGLYIMSNSDITGGDFNPFKTVFHFLLSRLFLGFCCLISGIIISQRCFETYEIFVNFTVNGNLINFLLGNGLILTGLLLMFVKRICSGFFTGTLIILFCALMIIQFPVIVLFFGGQKDLIETYYSNVAFHWSMIIAVIAYIIVGVICFVTSDVWRSAGESADTDNKNH